MADLVNEEWIVRGDEHPVVEVLQRSASAAGFTPRIAFHANDYQEAQAMVSVGLGVALAPRTAVVNKRAGGTGLITGRKAFQRPMDEGIGLLHAVQDVYLNEAVTVA